MIELYFWTTPNGMKPLIFLEETGLEHVIRPVDISQGAQFSEAFAKISANQKIPALVDRAPIGGAAPVALFESGAILLYLAERSGRFLPAAVAGRAEALQWLFWQMGGLGPMLGQYLHFHAYADAAVPYARERYAQELARLYRVLDDRLGDRDFVAGSYSIADMAIYPWIERLEREGPHLEGFAHLRRWHDALSRRPAVVRAYARAREINTVPTITEESKALLFGQDAGRRAA